MVDIWHHRGACRLCSSPRVERVVPLNSIPMSTPNLGMPGDEALARSIARERVPLDLYLCAECGLLQLLDIIDPAVLYTNFRYTTSISVGLPEHFRAMAAEVSERAGLEAGDLVLEIGSNDGTLLRAFAERGQRVLGVDPAVKAAQAATAAGVETLGTFFTKDLGRRIRSDHGAARVVICNNTLANIDEPGDLIEGVKTVLAEDGLFVFETSYGADVVAKTLIDTVYHEHLSYFTVAPLERFFAANGLDLVAVERIWTKGGSIRGFAQPAGGPRRRDPSVDALIAEETAAGLRTVAPYRSFRARLDRLRSDLTEIIGRAAPEGRLAAFGASVGGVTLISQLGLEDRLRNLYDDAPMSDALPTGEARNIPIKPSSALYEDRPEAVVILAWRYADRIAARHARYLDEGGRFLLPLPDVSEWGAKGTGSL